MIFRNTINFYVIKIRRNIFTLIFILFAVSLIIFSSNSIEAAQKGLDLLLDSVIPSLFPFFIATELLMHTNFIQILNKFLNTIMKPVFNVSGQGSFALIMGLLSGYPVGAKIVTNFRKNNICSKQECERLLGFTNNSSPLFIIGTIGISMYHSSTIGFLLFLSHFLGCLCVGFIFRFWKVNTLDEDKNNIILHKKSKENSIASISDLGKVLTLSVTSSVKTIVLVGGFIVLFSCIISILDSSGILHILNSFLNPILNIFNTPNSFSSGIIYGIIEVTNGVNYISTIAIRELSITLIITSFLLGLGGICVFIQVLSIVSTSDLSIKPYIYGKLLHALFSSSFTFLLIISFPFFNFNLV